MGGWVGGCVGMDTTINEMEEGWVDGCDGWMARVGERVRRWICL